MLEYLWGILPGWIAFAGVKFGGYYLAGKTLRKLQPTTTASAVRIAATRVGLGVLLGPPVTIGLTFALTRIFPQTNEKFPVIPVYTFIYVVRVLIWAFMIYHFVDELDWLQTKLWKFSMLGALWSCLLDLPGVGLALVSPMRIPIC